MFDFLKPKTTPKTIFAQWNAWKVRYEKITGRLLEGKEYSQAYRHYLAGLTPSESFTHLQECNFFGTQETK